MKIPQLESIAAKNGRPVWNRAKLGEVCRTTSGGTPSRKKPDFFNGSIPWVKSGELTDGAVYVVQEYITDEAITNSSAKVFPAGTLLIALYGATVGKLGILSRAAATNQAVCAVFPSANLDTKFLFWYLRHRRSDLVAQAVGGAQPNISQSILRMLEVPVPPLDEQRRIVAELEKEFSHLEAAIANLKRVKANIKRYKVAILKAAATGCLVPTEAELARRECRAYESADQLLRHIVESRQIDNCKRRDHKDPTIPDATRLPDLPEGWAWARYGQVGRLKLGRQRAPKYHTGRNLRPYLRVQNVFEDRIDLSDVMDMDFPPADVDRYELRNGDLLLNEGQSPELLGRAAIYRDELPGACFTNTLIRFRAVEGVKVEYALLVSRHYMHAGRFVDEGLITTNIAHLSLGRLAAIEFPLPPTSEQDRIVAEAERQLSIAAALERVLDSRLTASDRLREKTLQTYFRSFPGHQQPEITSCS